MAGWMAVLVDNKELVRFSRLREGESGVLNLTTMLPRQDQARVELYFVRGSLRRHIHTFHARGLRTSEPTPQIVVSGHVREEATVTLRVDGERVSSESFAVAPEMTRAFVPPWLVGAAIALLLVMIGGLWWLTAPEQTARAPEPTSPASNETAAPADAAPARIGLELTLYFEPESSRLLPEAQAELDATAAAITEWVDEGGDPATLTVGLTGHTALYGSEPSRLELSWERARNAAEYLAAELQRTGIPEVEFEVMGLGGREPVVTTEDAQWRNRRVELILTARRPTRR